MLPAWYSETAAGYWDIAGLPRSCTGNFISAGGELPAVLRFHSGGENGEYMGWYLSINGNDSFTFFLDPQKSAETIYSRQGKTPGQKKLKLNAALYVNPGRTNALEQNIIENSIKPFYRADQEGIDIAITYDGKIFELRESPPRHGSTLIFRGHGN